MVLDWRTELVTLSPYHSRMWWLGQPRLSWRVHEFHNTFGWTSNLKGIRVKYSSILVNWGLILAFKSLHLQKFWFMLADNLNKMVASLRILFIFIKFKCRWGGGGELFCRRHCKFLIERSQDQKEAAGNAVCWCWTGSYLITFLHYWICLHCIPCLWPGSSCAWRGWRERSTWGSVWAWVPPPARRWCRSSPWLSRTEI